MRSFQISLRVYKELKNGISQENWISAGKYSSKNLLCPYTFGLVVTPWRRTVWDKVKTITNWGWNGCSTREDTLGKGMDEGSVTAATRMNNAVGRQ